MTIKKSELKSNKNENSNASNREESDHENEETQQDENEYFSDSDSFPSDLEQVLFFSPQIFLIENLFFIYFYSFSHLGKNRNN